MSLRSSAGRDLYLEGSSYRCFVWCIEIFDWMAEIGLPTSACGGKQQKRSILYGVSDYYLQEATTFVKVLSDCVKNILNDPKVISANRSPKFYMHTKTWANCEDLDILWQAMQMTIPGLGALFIDMSEIVAHI